MFTDKLSREVESQSEEQSTYLAYDKGVKEIAEKLTISQVFICNTIAIQDIAYIKGVKEIAEKLTISQVFICVTIAIQDTAYDKGV